MEDGEPAPPAGPGGPSPDAAPTPDAPAPGGRTVRGRWSWPTRVLVGLGVVLAAVVVAGFVIHVDYTTIAPGEALSLPPRVTVTGGRAYPTPRGDIRLLFVRESNHVNLWQYLRARLDSTIDLVKDAAVNPGQLTPAQLDAQGLQQMADAKAAATAVALQAAGYRVGVASGLTVSDLTAGMPAIGVLRWGDVLVSADGRPLRRVADLDAAIARHKVGERVALGVHRGGRRLDVSVRLAVFRDGPVAGRKGIGVVVGPRFVFPLRVSVDTTNIGGPSAGLAMALAIYDDLTPGDLSGGHRVAVTGTIDPGGGVGEIGGIEQKALSARAAKVALFLVPQCSPADSPQGLASCRDDLARAERRAGRSVRVVPVASFAQALDVLRAMGGQPAAPATPATTTTVAA